MERPCERHRLRESDSPLCPKCEDRSERDRETQREKKTEADSSGRMKGEKWCLDSVDRGAYS